MSLADQQLSIRDIFAANFLPLHPPCEKAPLTFNQKSELRVTLKRSTYWNGILVWGDLLLATQTFLMKLNFL